MTSSKFFSEKILSGAAHYFRIPRPYWRDRLEKIRFMGLNTVETYVAWNLHEPRPGQFDFSGNLDIAAYVREAAEVGLFVIVRPGPYICSEWEFGGLPWWLLKDRSMRLRCTWPAYLEAADRFLRTLLARIVPLQESRGGPILAMQVENEYGSFGNDRAYLTHLVETMRAAGVDTPLFTSDGPTDAMLQGGSLPGLLETANFGSRAAEAFSLLDRYQPKGKRMCMEFWNGWFDHWGEEHHQRSPEDAAAALAEILDCHASVNLYMAHGGSNFGWMNGANCHNGAYMPTVTSYDYDAPISESGDLTPKFFAFREVLGRHTALPQGPPPANSAKAAYGPVPLTERLGLDSLLETAGKAVEAAVPLTFEDLDHPYGFVVYRTRISGPRAEATLQIRDLHDRAHVFAGGKFLGVLERTAPEKTLAFPVPPEGATLEILVENLGRVNYGPDLADRKGITEAVFHGGQQLFGWRMTPVPLAQAPALPFSPAPPAWQGPALYRGRFTVPGEPADTFLAVPGGRHGVCWINDTLVGRYWEIGPQKTLYVPAPFLHSGENTVTVFETDGWSGAPVEFRDAPELG